MSNLPPGVTPSMLPGNRPEDHERDQLLDRLLEALRDMDNADLRLLVDHLEKDYNLDELLQRVEDGHEAAHDRQVERYYGADTPQTDAEQLERARQLGREADEARYQQERQDAEDGVDRWADWEPAPEPYEPNPYDGTYSED